MGVEGVFPRLVMEREGLCNVPPRFLQVSVCGTIEP